MKVFDFNFNPYINSINKIKNENASYCIDNLTFIVIPLLFVISIIIGIYVQL